MLSFFSDALKILGFLLWFSAILLNFIWECYLCMYPEILESVILQSFYQLRHESEQALGVGDERGKSGMMQSMALQRVTHDWMNWTDSP